MEGRSIARHVRPSASLEHVRRQQGARLSDRLLEIGQDCAKPLKKPYRSADHGGLLYDAGGLPR